jgi:hypothetical protein
VQTAQGSRLAYDMRRWKILVIALVLFAGQGQAAAQTATPSSGPAAGMPCRTLSSACRTLEVSGVYFVEAWNFNGRRRVFVEGGTGAVSVTIRDGWAVAVEMAALRIDQRRRDAFVGGLSALMRRRLAERRGMTFFVEGGVGASGATTFVPEHGTRFNYLLQGGGGVAMRLGRHIGGIVSARLFHLSNASFNGPSHNPDIEALGGHIGIFMTF